MSITDFKKTKLRDTPLNEKKKQTNNFSLKASRISNKNNKLQQQPKSSFQLIEITFPIRGLQTAGNSLT